MSTARIEDDHRQALAAMSDEDFADEVYEYVCGVDPSKQDLLDALQLEFTLNGRGVGTIFWLQCLSYRKCVLGLED